MTDAFYRRNGGTPAPLPTIYHDAANNAFTPPYADEDLARLGFVLAPPRPADTDTQTAEWDAEAEAWAMVDRPPAPPAPEPVPAILFRLQFIELAQAAGGMTDAMLVKAQGDPAFSAFWIKFQMASVVERDDPVTAASLDALAGGGYLPKGKAAVVAAWPEG